MTGIDDVPPYRLTRAQATVLLGVHEITVSKWVSRGRLHSRENLSRCERDGQGSGRPSRHPTDRSRHVLVDELSGGVHRRGR
jgi:hypothetical protein